MLRSLRKLHAINGTKCRNNAVVVGNRQKSFVGFEQPTLVGSVLRENIINNIRKAQSSPNDNIEKRLLNNENTFSVISTANNKLALMLDKHEIDYCFIGGFALNVHGFSRYTTNVDVLMSEQGLQKFIEKILFNGFVPGFRKATKSFRDPVSNVGVNIITTEEYPGDGKEKNIKFPDPAQASEDLDGLKLIDLPNLINLKLASYLSVPQGRMKDRTDVAGLVKYLSMGKSFAVKLHPDVVDKFKKIVQEVDEEESRRI